MYLLTVAQQISSSQGRKLVRFKAIMDMTLLLTHAPDLLLCDARGYLKANLLKRLSHSFVGPVDYWIFSAV